MGFVAGVVQAITIPDPEVAQTFSFDAGSSANRVMKIWVVWNKAGNHVIATNGVTYNGVALTSDGAAVSHSTVHVRMQSFRLVNPASGSNTVSVLHESGFGTAAALVCVGVWDSIDQTTPQDGYASAEGTDTTAERTITSESGDTPVFCCAWLATAPTGIAPTLYTEADEDVNGSYIASFGYGTGAASVAFVGTLTAVAPSGWVALGANLNAAAAPAATHYDVTTLTISSTVG